MLYAETHSSKQIGKAYDWSPTLKSAVQAIRYWRIRIRLLKGASIKADQLHTLYQEAFHTPYEPITYTQQQLVQNLRDSYKNLRTLQQAHRQLRETHLDSLADAIVLKSSPNLSYDSVAHIRDERKQKVIKRLRFCERMKRAYKKIGHTLKHPVHLGLSRIDIPDRTANDPNLGDPDSPKSWKGPWISILNPEAIAKAVTKVNIAQYHQAHYM
jgi:hypothetical protein